MLKKYLLESDLKKVDLIVHKYMSVDITINDISQIFTKFSASGHFRPLLQSWKDLVEVIEANCTRQSTFIESLSLNN